VGESLGGWVAGLYVAEIGGGAHLIPVDKLVLVDAAGLKQDKPFPDLNPSSLTAMRGLMEAVFYDTSWLNEDALRKIFTDELAVKDGYTGRSILSNPANGTEKFDNRLASSKVPTLATRGKQDKLLAIGSGERYAAGIAGAKRSASKSVGTPRRLKKRKSFSGR